ncbi:Sulfate transporter [Fulvivirga imtechensis AK7]|uniref:Sulfate transporter n=1 Tax=Fulvivirga imtechensis AK7 TaxID=1237149 RepID=L8JWY6_9BACT|nr:SulP family inorganic anion transporter [Fulvivirga imtechensis]ELR73591.1 Sulfate transporter [Fulvivirga imtechensis AK7]
MNRKLISNLKSDIPSGLVVFLVALPLCLGIALASGAPLFSGIITGIIGGIVVGYLSGSSVSVSGPAAGLTVIVLSAIDSLGSYQTFLLAVLFAGIIQLLLGFVRAGIISHYFPSSVIKGMLAAIGLILILKQIPHALGWDSDFEGDYYFMQQDGENTFSELINAINFFQPGAIIITVVALGIMLLWERPALKKKTLFKIIPGGLVAVIAGILLNLFYESFLPHMFLSETHLVTLPVASSATEFIGQFSLPDFSAFMNPQVYVVAVTIAIIASIETLLCIEATDKLDPYKRITPTNRELQAQGVGNVICGLIGGLPMTSVIVRSSANIDAGAKSKMSAIVHGILLLTTVVILPHVLNLIPLAALAAILLVVGYKLAKVSLFKEMYLLGSRQFIPFVVTVVAILFTDLLTGIGIGMAVSIFYILRNNYKSPYHFESETNGRGKKIKIKLAEEVTFINKGSVLLTLRSIPENSDVVIDGSGSKNIDYDVKELLYNFRDTAKHKNIKLELKEIH